MLVLIIGFHFTFSFGCDDWFMRNGRMFCWCWRLLLFVLWLFLVHLRFAAFVICCLFFGCSCLLLFHFCRSCAFSLFARWLFCCGWLLHFLLAIDILLVRTGRVADRRSCFILLLVLLWLFRWNRGRPCPTLAAFEVACRLTIRILLRWSRHILDVRSRLILFFFL